MSKQVLPLLRRTRCIAVIVGLCLFALVVAGCGGSAGSTGTVSRQAMEMAGIVQDRSALLDGELSYRPLNPVRVGATENFSAELQAYSTHRSPPHPISGRLTPYVLKVGGTEAASLTAPAGGLAITAIGPTTGQIGAPGDVVSWTWSLKPAAPGTYSLDLVVVTYQAGTSQPLSTMSPPLVIKLIATESAAHQAVAAAASGFGAISKAMGEIVVVAGFIAGCVAWVRSWRKRRRKKAKRARTAAAKANPDGARAANAGTGGDEVVAADDVHD